MLRLRAAGCVFAEEEADVLLASTTDPAVLAERTARRVAGEPLEHVVGSVEFGDLHLSVGPGVFVPRRRTLLLARLAVEEATRRLQARVRPVVVEAFCGVAPVASTVRAGVPAARVHAIDRDERALEHARRNLADAGVHQGSVLAVGDVREESVHEGSVLAGLPLALRGTVDVIAAVPPYVPDAELDLLPHEAREHEPAAALLGGADGLDLVTALMDQAQAFLRPDGALLIELNEAQAPRAAARAAGAGLRLVRTRTRKDRTAVLHLAPLSAPGVQRRAGDTGGEQGAVTDPGAGQGTG